MFPAPLECFIGSRHCLRIRFRFLHLDTEVLPLCVVHNAGIILEEVGYSLFDFRDQLRASRFADVSVVDIGPSNASRV